MTEKIRAATPATTRLRVCSTLDDGVELVDRIAIGTSRGQKPVVVLSLGGGADPMPDLRAGDRLEALAEVEVTVDLTPAELALNAKTGGKATGKPYDFAPEVSAQLLLSSSPAATTVGGNAVPIGNVVRKKVNHDLHHAVFIFNGAGDGAFIDIPAKGLPWTGHTYVNLVLSASHSDAKTGQVLIVGQNNPDGKPTGKMASIALMRRRPGAQTDPAPTIKAPATASLPLITSTPKVIYSVPLTGLKANEQIRVQAVTDAKVTSGIRGRLNTEIFLADSPGQDEPVGKSDAASISSGKGKLTRGNGFNSLPGVTTRYRKAGAIRITKDASKTVYLNVVCTPGNPEKSASPGSILLSSTSRLTVHRFSPDQFG